MRILILSQWYTPEPGRVVPELAESLQAAGHEVTVLTGFPNYPSGKIYPGYRVRLFQRETINGIPVIRVPLYPDHGRSAIRRSLNYVSFALSCMLIAPWLVPRVDVIHVYNLIPLGMPARLLGLLRRAPFTYEIQDIWPESLSATGMLNNGRILGLIDRLAKWVYRRADTIRVISPGFRENLMQKGVPDKKIHVISNWVDTDFYRPVEPDHRRAEELGLAGHFNVMYAGAIGLAQGLETVLSAAGLLKDLPEAQFVFVGDGADLERLQGIAQERHLDNVKFLGRFPPEEMSELYALADVLLVHLRDDPLFRITVPHKVFSYMASGKPVLVAMAGDAAEVVQSTGCGLDCPPGDPQALAKAVREFHARPAAKRRAMGENGRRAVCESYGRDGIVRRISQMFEIVRENRRAGRRSKSGAICAQDARDSR